ncbi:MAG: hypothetical protein IJ399_01455 [Bacilli bacterium]|nr:hypothetical protein [Bacilli bacterium]MBQ8659824.1 hypothetical protein [Bacilli bacterium]
MKKKFISINNKEEYDKFLNKLSLYKSIFYFNTRFVVKNSLNDEMIDYIIKGLNLKNRKKRIEYIYDVSCKIIDDSVGKTNICGFKNGKCYVQRKLKDSNCNGCCRKCLYQTNKGCSSKNLSCKLYNCSEVKKRYKVIEFEDLKILRLLSLKNQFLIKSDYFIKREDFLKDLYTFTLTYAAIRIFFRLIRNSILFNLKSRK